MKIVGLDLSLSAIGVADDRGTRVITHKMPPHPDDERRCARLHDLSARVDIATRDADLVVIEGYSFGSQNSHAHSLGELGGLVKVILWRRGRRFVIIPPARMKQYAVGKGNASKEQVFAAAVRLQPAIETNDEADAWWLRHMAISHYRNQASAQLRKEVLGHIEWPRLEQKEEAVG